MLRVISSAEAVERLKAAGFNTNVNRLNAGLNEYVYEIYSTLLDQWIAERSERT